MKNIVKKYIILAIIILGPSAMVMKAQDSKHEVSVNGGFGYSTLKIKSDHIDPMNKMNATFGLGYSYSFTSQLAFLTGVDIAFYNTEFESSKINNSYETPEYDGTMLNFMSSVYSYQEKVKSTYLNIPIMLKYELPLNNSVKFYGAAGAKLGFNMTSKYTQQAGAIITSGSYPTLTPSGEKPTIITDIPEMGFTTIMANSGSGDLNLKFNCMAAIEGGFKFSLTDKLSLYGGLYLDYSLNDIKNTSDIQFVNYDKDTPENITNNPMSKSSLYVDNIKLVSYGIKLRLAFSM